MSLRPNTIKPAKGSKKTRRRVGRGNASGRGNYSCRGMKGQRSRSGGKGGLKRKGLKQVLQSTPKLRGFNSLKIKPCEVRLSGLGKAYQDGEVVNLTTLKEKKVIGKNTKTVKIIATGEIKKKLTIQGIKCTVKAKELIEKNGGEVK
ncbi:MAG: 50S ribosomal protein L15 [bacterium]